MKDRLEYKGAVIGMLMGDGSLSKDRKNAHYSMLHCLKQKDYCLWKGEILKQLTSVATWEGEVKAGGEKKYPIIRLWTKSHPFYTQLRARAYHANRKTFDIHMLKRLTDLGLLIWILDDGTRGGSEKTSFYLCTDRYSYIEQLSLQKYFHDRWNINPKIVKHGPHWRLRFPVSETQKLEKIMQKFSDTIPECMRYKLNLSYEAP